VSTNVAIWFRLPVRGILRWR